MHWKISIVFALCAILLTMLHFERPNNTRREEFNRMVYKQLQRNDGKFQETLQLRKRTLKVTIILGNLVL